MKIKILCTLICIILFSFISSAENQDEKNDFLLQKEMAGRLKLGMNSNDLYSIFNKNMTKVIDLKLEGNYCPAIAIFFDEKMEKPSLVAEISQEDDWHVWRIRVYDKRYKTKEGIGIGSTYGEINKTYSKKYNVGWSHHSEGDLYVEITELKLHFELDVILSASWSRNNIVPDDTKILSFVVH
ncbi:hypothetical protein ACFL6K_00010 [Candidatus Latescibacterota bacterium]